MMKHYLSFGGGVNSVALHLLMLDEGYDFESVFVNHGTDYPETYEYFELFQGYLRDNGHRPVTVLYPTGKFRTLMDKCETYRVLPGIMRRWCTQSFKVEIIHKYIEKPCFQHLGIDFGEVKRAKLSSAGQVENRFLLIEHEMDRQKCVNYIKAKGLPVPDKSGCYICPFQKASQWQYLRRHHPCLFQRVSTLEKANAALRMSKGKKPLYLSGLRKPLEAIVMENQHMLFDQYPPCYCGL